LATYKQNGQRSKTEKENETYLKLRFGLQYFGEGLACLDTQGVALKSHFDNVWVVL